MKALTLAVMIRDIARAEREGRATAEYLSGAAIMLEECVGETAMQRLIRESDEILGPGEDVVPKLGLLSGKLE